MNHFRHLATVTVLVFLFYLTFPRTAHAYLDPGTGSFLIQMILAALLGVSVTIRIYWGKIKTFFVRLFQKDKNDDS